MSPTVRTVNAEGRAMTDTQVKQCRQCERPITGANVYWHNPGQGRPRRPACRACKYKRTTKYKKLAQFRSGESAVFYTPIGGEIMATTSANAKNAPWNLYKVKPDAQDVWQQFQVALDSVRTPCFNDSAWTEYADPRYADEDQAELPPTPTGIQATEMCRACPLLAMCRDFARRERPDWGVYGGEVWMGGKVQK